MEGGVHCAVRDSYSFRTNVTDTTGESSGHIQYNYVLYVVNRPPGRPDVAIFPERPDTNSDLVAGVVVPSVDRDHDPVSYRYRWFLDGSQVRDLDGTTVPSCYTWKGERWSVEVTPYDGYGDGKPGTASVTIVNAKPVRTVEEVKINIIEDAEEGGILELGNHFKDPDNDALTYSMVTTPVHLTANLDGGTGILVLTPLEDWHGEEGFSIRAVDGEVEVTLDVTVTVESVYDPLRFWTVNGNPVTDGPVDLQVLQGNPLTIDFEVKNVEGEMLTFSANTSRVDIDKTTGRIFFVPTNDDVGTVRVTVEVKGDLGETPVGILISIHVVNVNDPMSDPTITVPRDGRRFEPGEAISFVCSSTDPDEGHGQVLSYSWRSDLEGELGTGWSLNAALNMTGTHIITVTVQDTVMQKETTVRIRVVAPYDPEPPPKPTNGDGDGQVGEGIDTDVAIVLLIVVVVVCLVAIVGAYASVAKRGRTKVVGEEVAEPVDGKGLEELASIAKQAADDMETHKRAEAPGLSVEETEKLRNEKGGDKRPISNGCDHYTG